MPLVARRRPDETWRQAVERIAGRHGLARECLAHYDAEVARGVADDQAAWNALYEWDVLDYEPDPPPESVLGGFAVPCVVRGTGAQVGVAYVHADGPLNAIVAPWQQGRSYCFWLGRDGDAEAEAKAEAEAIERYIADRRASIRAGVRRALGRNRR